MSKIIISVSDQQNAQEIKKALAQAGFQVVETRNNLPLRAQISVQNPDMIIADEDIVENEGPDLKKLFPDKPIVAWMSRHSAKVAVELITEGAFDCTSPPLDPKTLIGIVEYALKKAKVVEHETEFMRKYLSGLVIALIAVVAFAVSVFFIRDLADYRKPKTFSLTFQNPTGVFCSGNTLWVSDWYTQSIYKYRTGKNLKLLKTYYFQGHNPNSVAFIDGLLWIIDSGGSIRRYEVKDDELIFHSSFKTPGASPTGFWQENKYFWSLDAEEGAIFEHLLKEPEDIVARYTYPGLMPIGIYYDGEYFWTAEGRTGKIYRHFGPDRDFQINATYTIIPEGGGTLAGLSGDGANLWLVFSGQPAKVMRYPTKKLK
ncbi:MAG: hypothetical protein ABII64_07790 [Elusimicrobiota bacterium]